MSMRSWTAFLTVTLCGALVLLAYLGRRPLCIDSSLVEKIDRVSHEGTAMAFQCSVHQHVPFDEAIYQEIPHIENRLKPLERLFEDLSPLKDKITLRWLESSQNLFRIQDHQIFISSDLLQTEGLLEKAILKIWYRELAPEKVLDKPLMEEALTDLIYFVAYGKLTIDEVTPPARWPFVVKDRDGYCRSAWRSVDDISMCAREDVKENKNLVSMSLRPLLSESLQDSFQSLSAREQIQVLQEFPIALQAMQVHVMQETEDHSVTVDMDFLSRSLAATLQKFRDMSGGHVVWQRLTQRLETNLNSRGFSESWSGAFVHYLVMTESEGPAVEKMKKELNGFARRNPKVMLGIQSHSQLWFLPGEDAFSVNLFQNLRAKNGILIGCELPTSRRLVELSKTVEKLLMIKKCDDTHDLRLSAYLRNGIEGFALENQDVSFVQMHLPSFLQAWRAEPTEPLLQLSRKDWNSHFFKGVGWKVPQWDEKLHMYRPQSVIEAIEAYRM